MSNYFRLQYTMMLRQLEELGISPILGQILGVLAFVGISLLLFIKIDHAAFIYMMIALVVLSRWSDTARNDFLKSTFPGKKHLHIRCVENLIVSSPFVLFLFYQLLPIHALGTLSLAVAMALLQWERQTSFTIPTPFSRHPFEFTVGFRKTYVLIALAYLICGIAISVDNYNFGAFGAALIYFVSMFYYSEPEKEYYVWIYSLSPQQFLWKKAAFACLFAFALSSPILLALGMAFPSDWWISAIIVGIGTVFLTTVVWAKYSAYPNTMSLKQGLLIAYSIWFPPLLLGVMPYFYSQSVQRLKTTLS